VATACMQGEGRRNCWLQNCFISDLADWI